MPWPERRAPADMDSLKIHALQSLVAEKLLAQAARRSAGPDTTLLNAKRDALVRALARDALYRDVVAGVAAPPPLTIAREARRRAPAASRFERGRLQRILSDSLLAIARGAQAMEFNGRLLAHANAAVDSATFFMFGDSLRALVARLANAAGGAKGGATGAAVARDGYPLPADAPDLLRESLRSRLARPFVRMSDGPLSLGDVLEDLRFYPIRFHSLERREFLLELNTQLRTVVAGEFDARAALSRKLDAQPEVRHDVQAWIDSWRAGERLASVTADSARTRGRLRSAGAEDDGYRADAAARYVAELANRTHPRLDYAAARVVDLPMHNMVTKRLIGFGGQMPAAPLLVPFWSWVPLWRAAHTPLP